MCLSGVASLHKQNPYLPPPTHTQDDGMILFEDDQGSNQMRDERIIDNRSHMYFHAPLYFKGGRMKGHAWMHCLDDLDILHPDTKYLEDGIQLAYYATAYLGHGEIVTTQKVSESHPSAFFCFRS